MTKTTMSVQKALNELKLYDSKIRKGIYNIKVAAVEQKGAVVGQNVTIDQFKKEAKGSYDSVLAMISNRIKIKQAVILSNATTKVVIGGDEMTVAEAIERKGSVEHERSLALEIREQLNQTQRSVNNINSDIDKDAERVIDKALDGKSAKDSAELVKSIQDQYDSRKASVLDGIKNIAKKQEELSDKVEQFISDVDFKLTTSNCITEIEVDLED